jgi:hypothetical protein
VVSYQVLKIVSMENFDFFAKIKKWIQSGSSLFSVECRNVIRDSFYEWLGANDGLEVVAGQHIQGNVGTSVTSVTLLIVNDLSSNKSVTNW